MTCTALFSTYSRANAHSGHASYKNPIDDLLATEQLKSTLKKHNFFPKKEPNGLFHICFCPICNKSGDISSQKLYLYPKYSSYSCNNCTEKGTLAQLFETLKESSSEINQSKESNTIDYDRIFTSLQPISLASLPSNLSGISQLIGSGDEENSASVNAYQSEFGHFISCPLSLHSPEDNSSIQSGEYFECLQDNRLSFFKSYATGDFVSKSKGFSLHLEEGSNDNSIILVTSRLSTHLALSTGKTKTNVLFSPVDSMANIPSRILHSHSNIYLLEQESTKLLQPLLSEVGYLKFFTPKEQNFVIPKEPMTEEFLSNNFQQVSHPNLFSLENGGNNSSKNAGNSWNWEAVFEEYKSHSNIKHPLISLPTLSNLTKGFRPGELTIFSGPTGCGKTTFLSQLSLDYCSQGIVTLWGSFEIRNTRLIAKMFRQISNKPIESLSESELSTLQTHFQALPMHFMNFFGSTLFEDVLDAMEYSTRCNNTQHVILDNLQFMLSGQDSGAIDKFAIADRVIGQLREFASKRNVHVTLVVHPRKEDDGVTLGMNSISGTAKATQEADTVLILQNLAERGRLIEVKKNRFDGSLGSISLGFDKKIQMVSMVDL